VVFILIGTGLNLLGTKALKAVAIGAVIIEVIGSIGLGAYLLLFKQTQPITVIFESFGSGYGEGPWIWSGLLAAVAFVGWAFVGFESAGDIAEEVKDPERAVPKAMIFSILTVGIVVLFSALAVILAMPSIEAAVSGESVDPVADTMCEDIMNSEDYAILVAAVEAKVMSDLIKSQTRHLMESDDYNPDLYKNIVIAIADGCLDSSQDSVERAFTFNNHSELGLFVRASVCAYWEIKAYNTVKGEVQ
jgi:L-asparagine transporter-like permease